MNFPDLGLMESLSKALDTTPACLLGLEDADRDELVSSITEISTEQLEDAKKDMRWIAWSCIAAAILLVLVYQWIPRHTVQAYQTLHCMITVVIIAGLYLLFKYGEIKKWEPTDAFLFIGGFFSFFLYLFIQFFTGHSPQPVFGAVLISVTSVCTQLIFWRTMRPYPAKLLPMLLSAAFAIWHSLDGKISIQFMLPAICTMTVCAVCFWKNRGKCIIVPKRLLTVLCIALIIVLIFGFIFYPELVRAYVMVRHEHLESYAQNLLSEEQHEPYGFWSVSSYPDEGMVQFMTGGSGLAPGSTYEGFYYSADDVHIPFQGFDMEMDIRGDTAYWSENLETSDNWGTSTKITDHWYWFEAHF